MHDIAEKGRFELNFEASEIETDGLKALLNNIEDIREKHPDADVTIRVHYN